MYRHVSSLPYSLSTRSRWHGYRVCKVEVEVHGPLARLDEVQIAIGGLENFVISNGIDERYDGDDESDGNTEDEKVRTLDIQQTTSTPT